MTLRYDYSHLFQKVIPIRSPVITQQPKMKNDRNSFKTIEALQGYKDIICLLLLYKPIITFSLDVMIKVADSIILGWGKDVLNDDELNLNTFTHSYNNKVDKIICLHFCVCFFMNCGYKINIFW